MGKKENRDRRKRACSMMCTERSKRLMVAERFEGERLNDSYQEGRILNSEEKGGC
jgi:hypothetical protein